MLLLKEGFPESEELVLCTVTKIFHNGVFVDLDEYAKGGMIHISEVSPGRIRNIRDFVVEGKKVVCKVLRVNKEKGHIDLSLRRVTESQRKKKIDEIKQEQKSEKIIEFVAKKLDIDQKKLYEDILGNISNKYTSLYHFFEDARSDEKIIKKLGLPEDVTELLNEAIKQRIKEAEVEIKGYFKLKSYAPSGVDMIRDALTKAEGIGKEKTAIRYEGAGRYGVSIKGRDYKEAEKLLKESTELVLNSLKEKNSEGEFTRI